MKIRLLIIMFFLSLWACSPKVLNPQDDHGLTWRKLSQAKLEAIASNKPMLIDFFTSKDCPRCQILVANVYSDPAIVERINRDFVPVRVDLDSPLSDEEKSLAARLESGEECILAFLTAEGSIITDPEGKRICSMDLLSPDAFNSYLDNALKNFQK